ncbi:DUF3631 domain-containing protein [Arthrobacter antibioticus]|uniref:DUF3631 domain-containing protein n=1 Tax=Arthrobacter sp. H35-MC1 TaxID=3046203 RepID=UPI0024B87A14|nr:DUF3631 domain-containing protein [Arthrobacter sp. H35-MC1]MDJ0317853.1 DUF3631 domain-containing protein [Arthrobacter sp. H35-MC1]
MTATMDLTNTWSASNASNGSLLGEVLIRSRVWLSRFICVMDDADLDILALWAVHTHFCDVSYTTPRLQIDSTMPNSGKTTVLEHLERLSFNPLQASSISSPALIPRMIDKGLTTILIDEADRTLDPKKPEVGELIAIINAGYKRGASRPTLVPVAGGGWDVHRMPTYSPIAIAGNAPALPDDTRTRIIRVLLMPDFNGTVEESDWENIEPMAGDLLEAISQAADEFRENVRTARPELPEGCIGRMKEKWNPLRRIAEVAGGRWPGVVDELIRRDIEEVNMERADGISKLPPAVTLLRDVHATWGDTLFKPSSVIALQLAKHNPEMWGMQNYMGKTITTKRMAGMLSQAFKIHSKQRSDGDRARGYYRAEFENAWERFGHTPPNQSVPSVQSSPSVQNLPICTECGDLLDDTETNIHQACA